MSAVAALLAACAGPASTPTPAPAKPTEAAAPKPAAAATKPAEPTKPAASPTVQAQPAAKSSGPVTIRMSYWTDADTPSYKKAIEEFNKTSPNTKVELNLIAEQYQTKLQTQIAGGVAPDVARQNTGQFHAFALRNVWVDLDPYVLSDKVDKGAFWPQAITGASLLGKLYGMPSDLSPWYMYYIKPPFDKAGIPYPDATWDWNKVRDVAKALTKNSSNPAEAQWGFHVWNWWGGPTHLWIRQNGADFWNEKVYSDASRCVLDAPESIEAHDAYYGMLTKDQASPAGGFINSFAGGLFALYQAGKVAMWLGGSWMALQFLARWPSTAPAWGMVMCPHAAGKQKGGIYATDEHALWAGGKNVDASWQFLKFLGSEEGNRMLDVEVGRSVPALKKVAEDPAFRTWHGIDMKVALDALAIGWPSSEDNPYAFEITQILNPYVDEMYAGTKDGKTALPAVAGAVNKMLSEKRGR
jgi:multiple sugar transport system substrate-binding protein